MEEVVVEAVKTPAEEAEVEQRSAFVSIIRTEEHGDTSATVPQLLEESVGLTVRRFGGLGAFSTASVRGSSAEQVTILLDGVPLNRGRSGTVNLSNLPLRSLERIEVYRAAAPLRYRSSAIGGVINLVTKPPTDTPTYSLRGSYGSFDTYETDVQAGGRSGNVAYLFTADFTGSDGDFTFRDDNGTRANTADDRETTRRNNAFDAQDFLGKITYTPKPSTRIEIVNTFFHKHEGVPGLGAFQSEDADLDTVRNIANIRGRKDGLFSPFLTLEASGHMVYERTRFRDLQGEIGTGRQDNRNAAVAFGIDAQATYYHGDHHILSAVASLEHERFDTEDRLTDIQDPDTQKRTAFELGLEDELSLADERLTLTPQVIYTYLQNDFGGELPFSFGTVPAPDDDGFLSYRIGAKWLLSENLALKANAGRYYRYPNFSELFGDRGGVVGNPFLDPEDGVTADLGLTWEKRDITLGPLVFNRMYAEGAFFYSTVSDMIVFVQTSQRTVRAENVAGAETRGIEASWSAGLLDHFELSGNYTYLSTKNTSAAPFLHGNRLPGRPVHELFSRVAAFNHRARIFYELNYISENYLDQANLEKIDNRTIHNAGVTLYPRDTMTVTVEVKNFTDRQVADVLGYPLPGRSFVATLTMKF